MRELLTHIAREMAKGVADSHDITYCPACGVGGCHAERRKSMGEAVQREVDETCVYVCATCGGVCDDLPF